MEKTSTDSVESTTQQKNNLGYYGIILIVSLYLIHITVPIFRDANFTPSIIFDLAYFTPRLLCLIFFYRVLYSLLANRLNKPPSLNSHINSPKTQIILNKNCYVVFFRYGKHVSEMTLPS